MKTSVLIGLTGSIACYKICDVVRILKKKGFEITCAMTESAKQFITPLTMETLTGNKVLDDLFTLPETRDPSHISASDKADILLIAPATADIIGKIAAGICDDLLTSIICSSKAPCIVAPAMNENMYLNPIVQDKIEYLKKKKYIFVEPIEGDLACGRKGVGHLADIESITNIIEKLAREQ